MKEERIVKKIYNMNSNKTKWQKTCSRYIKLCEFRKMFVISLDGNIQPGYKIINHNGSSLNWSYNVWKKNINAKVQEIGLKKWRDGIATKETLNWYSYKQCPKHEIFYNGDEGSSLLFKCRTQSLEVNFRTYRWNEERTKLCSKCRPNLIVDETIRHLMAECAFYNEERESFMSRVIEIVGREQWNQLISSEGDNDLQYLLGLQDTSNIRIVNETKKFLTEIWKKRNN